MNRRELMTLTGAGLAGAAMTLAGPASAQSLTNIPAQESEVIGRAIGRLSNAIRERDPTLIDDFTPDALWVGASINEHAVGTAQIQAILGALYGLPIRLGFEWDQVTGGLSGDQVWLYAEGNLSPYGDEEAIKQTYRLSGVLMKVGESWKWRLIHGSQPITG